ncbi:MAG: diguanylate cyclase, partial [Firmicutes bacterium]|nr:diguanylate cyclase [Bacillota bacterium]
MKVDLPRIIYWQGMASMRYLILSLFVVGLVFCAVVLLLLERMVLSRLAGLSTSVSNINTGSDLSVRIPVAGTDELADLAGSVNRMLESLEKSHQQLYESEERHRTLTENTYDLISEMSLDGSFLYVSPNYKDLLDYDPSDFLGKKLADIIFPEDHTAVMTGFGKLSEYFTLNQLLYRIVCKNGELRWFESTGKTYKTAVGEIRVVFVSRDITERRRYEETIRRQAFHDALTGLPNRMLFYDRLTKAMAHAKRNRRMLSVLFMDLDQFKLINDTLGHAAGDQLLKCITERLTECTREDDTVARLGGDEFTLLLPEINEVESVTRVAVKILEAVRKPLKIFDRELYITTSIGIALYPHDGNDTETLLKNADTAMYQAKEKGRNNYQLYSPAINTRPLERHS